MSKSSSPCLAVVIIDIIHTFDLAQGCRLLRVVLPDCTTPCLGDSCTDRELVVRTLQIESGIVSRVWVQ